MANRLNVSEPSNANKNYISTAYGGKNQCIIINHINGSVLPNCVGYAWGRFMELLGKTPTLSKGNAGTWYSYQYDGYQRGAKPQLGSVICWSQYTTPKSNPKYTYGHVAIVEGINPDGSIYISQSGTYKRFWTQTIKANYIYPDYTVKDPEDGITYTVHHIFQGFIYNPNINSAFDDFVDTALKSIGTKSITIRDNLNMPNNLSWNVPYIYYCAKQAGISQLVPFKISAKDFITQCINRYGAEWHYKNSSNVFEYTPQVGDIVCLKYNTSKDIYYADRVAIVTRVNDTGSNKTIYCSEGDCNGKVETTTYSLKADSVVGFLTLNWNAFNASNISTIYQSRDVDYSKYALLREVGYIDKNQPLINMTPIRFSVLNYSTSLFDIFANSIIEEKEIPDNDYTFIDPFEYSGYVCTNGSQIFNEFIRQGFTTVMAIGTMSYMFFESGGWNIAAINMWENQPFKYRGRGLCQWSLGRSVAFVKAVPDWQTNLTGQVRYCANEMKTSYKHLYDYISQLKNTKANAKKAATKISLVYGAGLSLDWDETHNIEDFPYGGQWALDVHVNPAIHMWENNLVSKLST